MVVLYATRVRYAVLNYARDNLPPYMAVTTANPRTSRRLIKRTCVRRRAICHWLDVIIGAYIPKTEKEKEDENGQAVA
jgi:hypothetical protein